MGDSKFLLILCLFLGVVIYTGLRGVGWIAHMLVPGLTLGLVLFGLVAAVKWLRR